MALEYRRVPGSIIIGILAVTVISIAMGLSKFGGVFSAPPSMAPTLLQMDIKGALNAGLAGVIFVFFFVDLFDTTGTLIGVSHRAGLLDKDGKLPRLKKKPCLPIAPQSWRVQPWVLLRPPLILNLLPAPPWVAAPV